MDIEELKQQLIRHEALRLKPYKCPSGRLTIGVGRNLDDKGISEKEAMLLLENDIQECIEDLNNIFPEFDTLSDSRQKALIDLRFNIGPARFRGFKKMIAAVREKDFERASDEMTDSRWYDQVGQRAKNLTRMMREG